MTCLLGLAAQSPNSPNTDVLLNRCVMVSTAARGPVSNDPHLFIVCEVVNRLLISNLTKLPFD